MNASRRLDVRACIVGGGPAGVVLGYLLARAGHSVAILEKHVDFLRDFRGDTVHPSTMTVLDELGLLDEFLRQPHSEIRQIAGHVGKDTIVIGDFSHVPAKTKFLAIMPQWDFLNFLSSKARAHPGFALLMKTEATDVIRDGTRVAGVRAKDEQGELEIHADVVVACDGRTSTMRSVVGEKPRDLGAPMDVFWMRLSRRPGDRNAALGYVGAGSILVLIDRDDYWQCGYVIAKGSAEAVRSRGLDAFRAELAAMAPVIAGRVGEITSWEDVKLLSVAVDRLARWYVPGLLFIGDAAHAMSPIGGVGINLAVQDAVAAANTLGAALKRSGSVTEAVLAAVQRRRMFPTVMTQGLQVLIQRRIVAAVLGSRTPPVRAPLAIRVLTSIPGFRRIPAYIVGIGFRPEHVSREQEPAP
ncbi:MAG TPA: FAD-dependent oxidoreductase [Candidatus Baltobacteraceae bacterium]|nr:FAD-dependent oxidoreductase [Candidatus Baltobacteraceae bacterium]